ncbi:GLUG motif-containing protein [Desulfonatronum sp. SC1]|uniref:GLUG motif-containing protein n=1 Tax=Desulfonatronum sp. SC1 TaxID=2109626 RepID=UPI000D30893D|nr:GLUG motif-containing protein [Desulfonatronum sp. SC1]PTN32232.1 hypothetical protein C6366_16780 [Desulfonatronum sp. SC1]
MNKALSLVLTALLFLTLTTAALAQTATQPAGSGTAGNPYRIASLENLYWISQNSGEWDKIFKQTANIDFADATPAINTWDSGAGWTPIGDHSYHHFYGTYDGDGYTISGLFINRSDHHQGLFGYVAGATFKNIGLIDVDITGSTYAGGLVGQLQGTVDNSYVTGSVSGDSNVGGLVGFNTGSVTNCYATASVSGDSNVGGLVGSKSASGTVTNSFYDTNTTGQSDTNKGTPKTTAQMKNIATFNDPDATDGLTTAWPIVEGWAAFQSPNNIWGICQGTNNGYPFLLSQYNTNPCIYSLSVRSFGASNVSITANPAIYGGTTNYAKAGILFGTTITLTAPATSGSEGFLSWTDCNSTNQSARTCTITMNGSRTVTARFDGDRPKAQPGVLMLLLGE